MAGGPNAAQFPCVVCDAQAERTEEGREDDVYVCVAGHTFSIDWSRTGPAQEPCWPPQDGA